AHDHAAHGEDVDLVIVGAGPAGLSAGIYGVRSGMSTVILEKSLIGGQVALTPVVENYPGFAKVPGMELINIMSAHTREYADIREGETVSEIKLGKNVEVYTNRGLYRAKALILATGATWKQLGVPGEDAFYGRGVHNCASCDGYMYKDKIVAVVGGGNTALTEALHLHNLGVKVSVIHRRDEFRAEQRLQESLDHEDIEVLWNTEVVEILGDDGMVMALKLRDNTDGSEREMLVHGVFIAIGQVVNSQLLQDIGVAVNSDGSVKVDGSMRTNIPRIYAAGDVIGGVQQIVTAIGEGSTAALAAFEDISHPYWKPAGK
ncbi:MAG: thioredoxin reductase, partial [Desulfovibrio sp.]